MPLSARIDPAKIVEAIRLLGAERCIMSTDFGQAYNPAPAEGMRMMIATMLRCGLTERELETMIKVNPAKLLDLD
jgi:predicted TIM-barrel fold metal-dependent hydrolase